MKNLFSISERNEDETTGRYRDFYSQLQLCLALQPALIIGCPSRLYLNDSAARVNKVSPCRPVVMLQYRLWPQGTAISVRACWTIPLTPFHGGLMTGWNRVSGSSNGFYIKACDPAGSSSFLSFLFFSFFFLFAPPETCER